MFGMLLRNSEFKGDTDTDLILEFAKNSLSDDKTGYKSEFIKLVELSEDLDQYAGTIGE